MSPGETPDWPRAAGQPHASASAAATTAVLPLALMGLGLGLLEDAYEAGAGERAVVVAGEVHRVALAGHGDLAAVGLPGAVLHLAADGQIGLAPRTQLQHDVSAQVAVGAFQGTAAGGVDQAREDQPHRQR